MEESDKKTEAGEAQDTTSDLEEVGAGAEPTLDPADELAVADQGAAPIEAEPAVPTLTAAPRRGGFLAFVAVLALLLAVAAALASGWLYYQTYMVAQAATREPEPGASQARLEAELANLRQAAAQRQSQTEELLQTQQRRMQELLEQRTADYERRLAQLQLEQNGQRERLLEFGATDRSDWLLAEAEYLLRLANQRIIMAGDVRSAIALLQSADDILLQLDAADLLPVRGSIANDLAALRAVPAVDVDGTWFRLQAIMGRIEALRLFEVPEQDPLTTGPAPGGGWRERLQQGLDAALEKLARYIVIRRRDTPYEPLMGPQWEQLVRQNLRMLLEQARSALLSGNQPLYEQSLANARFWLAEFFNQDSAGVEALDEELQALGELTVERSYPDVTTSMMAVKSVINARHLAAGGS